MTINGKYTTVRYSWIWVTLVQVMMGTSTSIRNGNTWYSSIVNHMMTNKHTDGIVKSNVTHGNQVSRSNIICGNTLSSHDRSVRVHQDAFATNYVLNSKISNACKLLREREVHDKDNTLPYLIDQCINARILE